MEKSIMPAAEKNPEKKEITREVFNHLVQLAAFELSEDQAQYLLKELNRQLEAIHELENIPLTDETPVTSHGVPYSSLTKPALREDQWQPFPTPEDIVARAPQIQDGYFVVPDIPHTTLE